MLLQANDFRWLCEHQGCELQMGGSDQWGNITAGIDLIRRTLARPAYGLTWPLLTKADGTKFGKTADGSVWLDPAKTSPYQFRQFWVQADDAEVERYLLQFTLLPVGRDPRPDGRARRAAPERRVAQRLLARRAHRRWCTARGRRRRRSGRRRAVRRRPDRARRSRCSRPLRAEVPDLLGRPSTTSPDVVALLVRTGLASSNGDARRTLGQRGYQRNGRRLEPDEAAHPG